MIQSKQPQSFEETEHQREERHANGQERLAEGEKIINEVRGILEKEFGITAARNCRSDADGIMVIEVNREFTEDMAQRMAELGYPLIQKKNSFAKILNAPHTICIRIRYGRY